MNKKLLAAAIAAAVVAAPAAFADSTVYGKFHTSVDINDFDYAGDSKDVDNYSMESRASRLGFKGSEDLGNGLKAIYQVELSVQTDGNDGGKGQDGGDGWGGQRNTFIGLSGGWGTLLVGRHDTPMKVAFYGSGNERLGDSVIDLNLSNGLKSSSIKGSDLEDAGVISDADDLTIGSTGKSGLAPIGVFSEYRADNAIAYISPSFGGFTFAGAVIPGEDGNGGLEGDGFADHYSLGAMWSGNAFKVSGGYQDTEAGDTNQKTWQLGGSFNMNAFSVGAQYEDTTNFGFIEDDDYTAWAVTGKFTFGNNAISAVYTDSSLDTDGGNDVDTSGWGLAAEHNFSKRTMVYAAYADDTREYDVGEDDDVSVFSIGMIHNF